MVNAIRTTILGTLIGILCILETLAAEPAAETAVTVCRGDKPFVFGFGEWVNANKESPVETQGVHLATKNEKGGAGWVIAGKVSLADYGDWTPALKLTATDRNKARNLVLHFGDADETGHVFRFQLQGLEPGKPTLLTAEHGASLLEPETVKEGKTPGLDLAHLAVVMLIGDWSDNPVDLVISEVVLVPPTSEMKAQRAALRKLHAREAEQARRAAEAKAQARRDFLKQGAPHPQDGPKVRHVCAVAPDVLSITLQAGDFVPNTLSPYTQRPGDEVVVDKASKPQYFVRDGAVVEDHDKAVFRTVDGKRIRLGLLSPDGKRLFGGGKTAGQLLDETAIDLPDAYTIQSPDDPAYAKPLSPKAVFRKGKPNGYSRPLPFVYAISLELPSPLTEGATYTVRFVGVNTSQETVNYVHRPREIVSEAVHTIQTGYRPDDPLKRAYLSVWLGAGVENGRSGACTHRVSAFELIDAATGRTVFTGKPELTKAADAKERLCVHEEKDYTLTAVHRLDFSGFSTPGEYRVYVPGIGTSRRFRIDREVWLAPFKAAMQGIVAQRQGIELGPPVCQFRRPRAFHPDDGVEFYQLTIAVQEGQEAGEGDQPGRGGNLLELAKSGNLKRVEGVWGGYQDAGDWDTLGHHLNLTYLLLELYELAPEFFAKVPLSLPANEQANGLPDLVDEALWQMGCFRRLQLPDGSVRGGYGEGWGCLAGQTSDMVKSAGVYAPDHVTTYTYAACTARAARVLAAFDKQRAAKYLESGKQAWDWGEAHSNDRDPTYRRLSALKGWPPFKKAVTEARTLAAVEFYAATGEAPYHEVFKQSTELAGEGRLQYMDQADADFAYARLPDNLADAKLKQKAVDTILAYADYAVDFSRKNAFEIINGSRTDLPVIGPCTYFSAPGVRGYNLVRAYVLSRRPAHLAAAVQACNYPLGANPDNLSYCPGIGRKFVQFPFKVDAAVSGQYPDVPIGYIPFGQGDEASPMCRGMNGWVQQWVLNFQPPKMVPDFYTWPVNELYIDFGVYPMMNENTLNSTTLASAYFWGFLASRPEIGR